jgi:hypothetical protein
MLAYLPLNASSELPVNATSQPVAWYQNVLQTAAQGAQQYLTLKQQYELMQLQTERARMGLDPLDVSQYTPGVSLSIDSRTRNALLFGVLIIGGAMLLRR